MPFVMDQDVRPQNLKDDGEHTQEASAPLKNGAVQVNGAVLSPGVASLPNGVPAQKMAMANGQHTTAQDPSGAQSPPELDGEWRTGWTNKSMGTMIHRLSQTCFRDLNETLTKMAENPIRSYGQPNGVVTQALDIDQESLSKKRTFMEFASNQRDRFTKALVLSDWARNSDDMARLIDVLSWQRRQDASQLAGVDNIGYIKRDLATTKMPNPNITGALHFLGTGKALPKTPDLGYIPPKRMTAKQLLRLLQDMNVILATRINLHEQLPEHLRDFSIADGRATFRVPGEFEVDLSVADEDTSTPFYFIDFRFLFSPALNMMGEGIRNALEAHMNEKLRAEGLQGCFDHLHNFVLTHKINVLRSQFRKLLQEKWFDCARSESRGRTLTIQYWLGRPGRKSWLEFGVATGKQRKSRSEQPPAAELSVRWFRDAELVENPGLDIDWDELDLERIVSGVIARHLSWAFESAKHQVEVESRSRIGPPGDSNVKIELTTSNDRPQDCTLTLFMPGMQTPATLQVEPVSGRFSIKPATRRSAEIERTLNADVNAPKMLPRALSALLCKTVQDRVDKACQLVGWKYVTTKFRPESIRGQFGNHVALRAYKCNEAWGSEWVLFATFSLTGDKWWIARSKDRPQQSGAQVIETSAKIVVDARQLPVRDLLATNAVISRSSLLRIEKMAEAEVSFAVLSQQLSSMNIPYRIEKTASLTFKDNSAVALSEPTIGLFFRGSTILKDSLGKDLAVDCVRLTHAGVRREQPSEIAEMRHEIRLTVETGVFKNLRAYLSTQSRDAEIAMNESGALALRLRAPFGQPYMDQLVTRVRSCDRLDRYLRVMTSYGYKPITVNLNKVAFTYEATRDLSAVISFNGKDGGLPARLELKPVGSNPHQRIRVAMEQMINDPRRPEQAELVGTVLGYSQPTMFAFETIESRDVGTRGTSIHVRTPLSYVVAYKAPLPVLNIRLELKKRIVNNQTIMSWSVTCGIDKQELQKSEFGRAWLEFGAQKSDPAKWSSLGDGSLIGALTGVQTLVLKLDEVVRKFKAEDAVAKQETTTKVDDAKPQAAQQQSKASTTTQQQQNPTQQQQSQQRQNQPKPAAPRPNPPAPTANMNRNSNNNTNTTTTNNNNNNNQSKTKQEIIELD